MKGELPIERPRSVDVAEIERTLNELWRDASGDTDATVVRACILNLIVVTEVTERTVVAESVVELTSTHPSRVIIVLADPESGKDGISAEVSAQCHLSLGKRKQVCSEMVILTAGGSSAAESHSVVAALINSDLPTCLWWRTPTPPEGHFFDELVEICDHLIFDSATTGMKAAERLVRTAGRSVGDLSWGRLNPWRSALALFYDVPAYRAHLDRVGDISIECDLSKLSTEPALLAGWLASRLGFELRRGVNKGQNAVTLDFVAGNRELTVTLSEADVRARISAVSLRTNSRDGLGFAVRLQNEQIESYVLTPGGEKPVGSPATTQHGEAKLVAEELYLLSRDPAYEQALRAAVEIETELNRLGS